MLRVVLRDNYPSLANALADDLAAPRGFSTALEQAMAPEWIVTPSSGTKRWLTRELSRNIGATPGTTDGIVANWLHEFPTRLQGRVLDHHLETFYNVSRDPWALPQLQFTLFEFALANPTHEASQLLRSGGTQVLLTRARFYADLFDRYHLWRPDMVLKWLEANYEPASEEEKAQRALWQAVRTTCRVPSPPERAQAAWDELDAHPELLPVRDRLSIFGLTAFPGGSSFLETLERLSNHVPITLYLVDGFTGIDVAALNDPMDFSSSLLRLWGGAPVANAPLIARLTSATSQRHEPLEAPISVLDGLKYTLRTDVVHPVRGGDASIIQHLCYGPKRQVEVLRDALRHDLATNPSWQERDLLVICPDLELFAPLIRTAFGPPRRGPLKRGDTQLAYEIFDANGSQDGPYLQGLRHLLQLISSQCTRSDVLSFLAEPVVSRRRRLDAEDLEFLATWTKEAGVRWGLNAAHRAVFGIDGLGEVNTWAQAMDRLQLGFMVQNPAFRAVDELLPVEVPGQKFHLLANVADFIQTLSEAIASSWSEHTLAEWFLWFDDLAAACIRANTADQRGVERVRSALFPLRAIAEETNCLLTVSDFSRLLGEAFDGAGSLGSIFTGGITITTPDTLRWVPFTATYLLGFDDGSFMRPELEAADLRRMETRVGEIGPNDDARSRLSELLLSTKERLTILRTSHDLGTGEPLDPAITYSEFLDGISELQGPNSVSADEFVVTIQHPRHGFDTRNFTMDQNFDRLRALGVIANSWSFSEIDERLAEVREQSAGTPAKRFADQLSLDAVFAPPTRLTTSDIGRFIENPPRAHLRFSLGISLSDLSEERLDTLDGEFSSRLKSTTVGEVFRATTRDEDATSEAATKAALSAMVKSGDLPPSPILPLEGTVEEILGFHEVWRDFTATATQKVLAVTVPFGEMELHDRVEVFERSGVTHVVAVITSTMRFEKLLTPWVRALAVKAHVGDATPVMLTVIYRPKSKQHVPAVRMVHLGVESAAVTTRALHELARLFSLNLSRPLPFEPSAVGTGQKGYETSGFVMPSLDEDTWNGASYTGFASTNYMKNRHWRAVFGHLTADDLEAVPETDPSSRVAVHQAFNALFKTPLNLYAIELEEKAPKS